MSPLVLAPFLFIPLHPFPPLCGLQAPLFLFSKGLQTLKNESGGMKMVSETHHCEPVL